MAKKKSGDTREKLLEAASEAFAAKGFRAATVAEICARAEANIAAVNYYFGSKEALYQEAWRHSFAESIRLHPQDGGVGPEAPAEQRLSGQVKSLIERIADKNNREFFISQMELVDPTGLLEEVMFSAFIPQREKTLSIVRELLGPAASEAEVAFSETCIVSMCIQPMIMQGVRQRARNTRMPAPIADLGAFADHVVRFALAGMAAIGNDLRAAGKITADGK